MLNRVSFCHKFIITLPFFEKGCKTKYEITLFVGYQKSINKIIWFIRWTNTIDNKQCNEQCIKCIPWKLNEDLMVNEDCGNWIP